MRQHWLSPASQFYRESHITVIPDKMKFRLCHRSECHGPAEVMFINYMRNVDVTVDQNQYSCRWSTEGMGFSYWYKGSRILTWIHPSTGVAVCALMRPHTLWTCILDTPWTPAIFYINFPMHFWSIFDYFNILWFTFDFSKYEQYHMLITQPLQPITNRIAGCFTFIPSFLPSAYHITGDWGIFTYITWP